MIFIFLILFSYCLKSGKSVIKVVLNSISDVYFNFYLGTFPITLFDLILHVLDSYICIDWLC